MPNQRDLEFISNNKLLIFDTETTGLDAKENDIVTFSGCITRGFNVEEWFDYKIKPFNMDNITEESVETHGISKEEMSKFESPDAAYKRVIKLFGSHVNKFNKQDKMYPCGFNVRFDLDMVNQFFIKNKDKYFGSWQNWTSIDILDRINWLIFIGRLKGLKKRRLEYVAPLFDIEIEAHNSLSDIKATMKVMEKLYNNIKFTNMENAPISKNY